MSKLNKPILHGRDHEHGGADPARILWEDLGSAGTPIIVGNNNKGTGGQQNMAGANGMWVGKVTVPAAGTLTELHGWFRGGTGTQNVRLIVYDDDGAGAMPGTRLVYTGSYPLPTSSVDLEVAETGLSIPLAAGDYWLGWIHEFSVGGTFGCYYDDGGPVTQYIYGSTYTPPQTPFGTPSPNFSQTLSVWMIVMT